MATIVSNFNETLLHLFLFEAKNAAGEALERMRAQANPITISTLVNVTRISNVACLSLVSTTVTIYRCLTLTTRQPSLSS
jgi:hypothetical protein